MLSTKKKMLTCLIGLALAGAATVASAQSSEGTQGGVSMHYGIGDHYQRFTLNYETPSVWTHQFGGNWGRLDLTPELGASYWWADGSRSPGHVWQLNAIPMFRWWTGERFYLEAGIGATVFSSTRFANENISTAFQFGDHVGMGFLLTPNNRIGVRYSHFSNASIKRPNPGLDLVQLTYTYQF
ncbi:acyloxyacyl hydrolase [Achromobacter marplatensis]|jgi:lipid A 3-O-deacylase|uniref:Lipid A deacylase n=1 Tax=Achromobacter marplatensis TaxID=470868 RepID=A0AA43AZV1_9BURK|nr:acyloxyacyl hydrolase [Achromobacter marplatensis]EJO32063.1 lipid A 3-O-deacylase PagL family protein [Achromobacter marplatensis]MDH2049114.1 acyloxyacyl hydrolase [Achromobacter marplatensis]